MRVFEEDGREYNPGYDVGEDRFGIYGEIRFIQSNRKLLDCKDNSVKM